MSRSFCYTQNQQNMENLERLYESFSIGKMLGNGSQGKVFLCTVIVDNITGLEKGKEYAFKISFFKKQGETNSEKEFLLFKHEYGLITKLDHPNIVKCHGIFVLVQENKDTGEKEEIGICLALDYIPGQNLFEALKKGEYFSEQKLTNIFEKCLETIEYLHEKRFFTTTSNLKM